MQPITETVAKQTTTLAINDAVKEELSSKNLTYDDFVQIQRDNNGNVVSMSTNMATVNTFKADITSTIQETLLNHTMKTQVPLGTLIGWNITRGHGPNIALKVGVSGNISVDFQSSFESAGINQTIHRIYLTIRTSAYAYFSLAKGSTDVDTSILVAETVIVGEVPQIYMTSPSMLQGMTGSNSISSSLNDTTSSMAG